MKRGPTTAKELFGNQIADLIYRENTRRKYGMAYVQRHVVRIVNQIGPVQFKAYTKGDPI